MLSDQEWGTWRSALEFRLPQQVHTKNEKLVFCKKASHRNYASFSLHCAVTLSNSSNCAWAATLASQKQWQSLQMAYRALQDSANVASHLCPASLPPGCCSPVLTLELLSVLPACKHAPISGLCICKISAWNRSFSQGLHGSLPTFLEVMSQVLLSQ